MEKLARNVAIALMDKGYTIATIEECTCGLIGAAIASQKYAQRWYKGTIVPYTEDMAIKLLGHRRTRIILWCRTHAAGILVGLASQRGQRRLGNAWLGKCFR